VKKSLKNIVLPLLSVNVVIILLILALQNRLPPVVPLFYGKAQGEEQLVSRLWLTLPSLVSILIIIVNTLFIRLIKDAFLQKVLLGLIIVSVALSSITIVKIIFLIGNI
jgi:hypothetical protein